MGDSVWRLNVWPKAILSAPDVCGCHDVPKYVTDGLPFRSQRRIYKLQKSLFLRTPAFPPRLVSTPNEILNSHPPWSLAWYHFPASSGCGGRTSSCYTFHDSRLSYWLRSDYTRSSCHCTPPPLSMRPRNSSLSNHTHISHRLLPQARELQAFSFSTMVRSL